MHHRGRHARAGLIDPPRPIHGAFGDEAGACTSLTGSGPGAGPLPVHVHLRYPAMDDWWCRYIAATAHVVVANVAAALAADGTPVSVGGFSSGGGLAGSVALDLSAEPRDDEPGMFSPELRRLVRPVYVPDPANRLEPYASPLLAPDLRGLPPAIVLTAERDVLRAEGDAYAHRLRAAGVRVIHDVTPDVDHYFLTEDPVRA